MGKQPGNKFTTEQMDMLIWLGRSKNKFYEFIREYLVAIGQAEERERIIKLLEDSAKELREAAKYASTLEDQMHFTGPASGYIQAVALIKGEE
jgi:hypothetical protein